MEIQVTSWCVCCNTQTCLLGTHGAGTEGPCEKGKMWSFYVQDSKPHIHSDCKTLPRTKPVLKPTLPLLGSL